MENNTPRPMTPFDELVTSSELQMIKLLLPYIPSSGRRPLAACIKLIELRHTLSVFRDSSGICAQMFRRETGSSPLDILGAIRPYLGEKECETFDMILSLKDMMSMMDMMKNASGGNDMPVDPMELISGMLSPEQQEMFQAYSSMFSQASDADRKGDESDERVDEQSGNEEYGSGETGTDPDGSRPDLG